MIMHRFAVSALSMLLLVSAASGQTVWVVDQFNGPGANATEISTAVAQASPGDIVLVRSGSYDHFVIDGKGLSVVRDAGADVLVHSNGVKPLEVRNMPAGQEVLLFGLQFAGAYLEPSIHVHDNLGSVVLDQCVGEGGWPMVDVSASSALTLADCDFVGSQSVALAQVGLYSLAGSALRVAQSVVAVQGGHFRGGDGIDAQANGLNENVAAQPGAAAVTAVSGTLFLGGCTLTGGEGGDASCSLVTMAFLKAEPGGSGLALTSGSPVVTFNDAAFVPGAAGAPTALCPSVPPAAPPTSVQTGTLDELLGAATDLVTMSPVRETQLALVTVTGTPGSAAALLLSLDSTAKPIPHLSGALGVGGSPLVLAIGTLPASGSLTLQGTVPELGVEGLAMFLQPAAFAAGVGHVVLGRPASLVFLDSSQ
jgi:hypothetical protein